MIGEIARQAPIPFLQPPNRLPSISGRRDVVAALISLP